MDNQKIKGYCLVSAFTVAFYLALSNLKKLSGFFTAAAQLLTPFLIGLVIAFLLSGILRRFERKVFVRLAENPRERVRKLVRPLSLLSTYLLMLLVLTLLFSVVMPQLATSVKTLVDNVQPFLTNLSQQIEPIATRLQLDAALWAQLNEWLNSAVSAMLNFVPQLLGMLPQLYSFAVSVGGGVFTFAMGIVLSIYMLLDKEHLVLQLQRVNRAFLPRRVAGGIEETVGIAVRTFEKYVGGQLLDALIVGIVSVAGLGLLGFPFAMLVGTVMGITNIVPFFGPVLGAIPGFFIILMADPGKALWYILFVVVLQQVDGNLLVPRIIGSSVGLPPLWVLFSVIVGGGLFGIPGMILGTPIFAVVYQLVSRAVRAHEAGEA